MGRTPAVKIEIPEELRSAAKTEAVDALSEKVDKCFSEDRFEHFQKKVRSIVLDTMGHEDGIAKIKKYGKESAKEYSEENGKEKRNFWTPNGISIIGILVGIVAVLVAILKP
ncbi:MAG: hypothetical protein AAB553_06240 [Patescibacteria group bacterium]